MFINIHTHHKSIKEENVFSIYNLNVPEHLCRCGLDLQNTSYSLGIHPWKINSQLLSENLRYIEENALFAPVKAIGECGLDKLCETPPELQIKAFQSQIIISEKVKKPLIIHCVKAFDDLIALKKEINPIQAWIIHGFRGKPELMYQLVNQGFYLSFGYRFNEETVRQMPLDKLFLETDDENISIEQIYSAVSNLLNIKEESLRLQLQKNFAQRFN